MREPIIVFEHVSKSYPSYFHISGGIKNFLFHLPKAIGAIRNSRFEALRDISFAVDQGETLGIIGENGAGKTTALGLIAGVLKPSKGRVVVKGRISPLLELGAGFHMELTGRENIVLNGVLMGLNRAEVLDEIIEFSELDQFIDQPIRTYSSGMLARLGFSVVSSLEPEILLIDEVLAVGDIHFQKKCVERMMGFKESGVTMVFVSHSMKDVRVICDRVMWIDHHVIKAVGIPKDVIKQYFEVHRTRTEEQEISRGFPRRKVEGARKPEKPTKDESPSRD
jgi:lipopolysaccharide transport system ATP-binding protein